MRYIIFSAVLLFSCDAQIDRSNKFADLSVSLEKSSFESNADFVSAVVGNLEIATWTIEGPDSMPGSEEDDYILVAHESDRLQLTAYTADAYNVLVFYCLDSNSGILSDSEFGRITSNLLRGVSSAASPEKFQFLVTQLDKPPVIGSIDLLKEVSTCRE